MEHKFLPFPFFFLVQGWSLVHGRSRTLRSQELLQKELVFGGDFLALNFFCLLPFSLLLGLPQKGVRKRGLNFLIYVCSRLSAFARGCARFRTQFREPKICACLHLRAFICLHLRSFTPFLHILLRHPIFFHGGFWGSAQRRILFFFEFPGSFFEGKELGPQRFRGSNSNQSSELNVPSFLGKNHPHSEERGMIRTPPNRYGPSSSLFHFCQQKKGNQGP